MLKRLYLSLLLVLILFLPLIGGCLPKPQQANQTNQEGPPPDLTNIQKALMDPSKTVRRQALETLKQYTHSAAIQVYIDAIIDNYDDSDTTKIAVDGLKKFKEKAVDPVKKDLWNNQLTTIQFLAFNVLSEVDKKEDFYPQVQDRFYMTPYTKENEEFRAKMAEFLLRNADKTKPNTLADIVAMLTVPDPKVVEFSARKLSEWKDPHAEDLLVKLYANSNNDPIITGAILNVLRNYDVPSVKTKETSIHDISVFLDSFGSYDKKVQEYSYQGLKSFGYKDKDDKILPYIKRFENCDSDVIRSNVVDLLNSLPMKQYPQDITPPTFTIPTAHGRKGFCI